MDEALISTSESSDSGLSGDEKKDIFWFVVHFCFWILNLEVYITSLSKVGYLSELPSSRRYMIPIALLIHHTISYIVILAIVQSHGTNLTIEVLIFYLLVVIYLSSKITFADQNYRKATFILRCTTLFMVITIIALFLTEIWMGCLFLVCLIIHEVVIVWNVSLLKDIRLRWRLGLIGDYNENSDSNF
mmetsp:Transcript_54727/g.62724  ORF Transcript_54727/g.62724 Transcript_54727/m.62724 type:complete len:188 (+) Transcript_54727:156-719(+)